MPIEMLDFYIILKHLRTKNINCNLFKKRFAVVVLKVTFADH